MLNYLTGKNSDSAPKPTSDLKSTPKKESSEHKIQPINKENELSTQHVSTIFVPFIRGVSSSLSDQFEFNDGRTGKSAMGGVANDLMATVKKYESKGYKFQRIETIHVDVSPGCIGMLMGKGKEYHPYDYLVFEKLH
tara:strand:- start:439 stop:849 length:411 start_codon:yes stop_codon:yes gene_type:complete